MNPTRKGNDKKPYNVLIKPIGAICNLRCEYCFYLEKTQLYPDVDNFRMSDTTLDVYTRDYIRSLPGPAVSFGWQGGEPLLMGLDYFQRAMELQAEYLPSDWRCENSIQTNGTLLDEEWCEFLRENDFLVGISIDGPAEAHDVYRTGKDGKPTHQRVMEGLCWLKECGTQYNILCVVNSLNADQPREVYNFFKDAGAEYIQFIPLVEHLGGGRVTGRTVDGAAYGKFLISIFNEWITSGDLGAIFVQIFEECVRVWSGYPPSLCVFSSTCGQALALEHNGDLYACDHFVVPEHRLGNIHEEPIGDLAMKEMQLAFGQSKCDTLTSRCQACPVLKMCRGGCIKNRIHRIKGEEHPLNHLCEGYRRFFAYVDPFMEVIAEGIKNQPHVNWEQVKKTLQQEHDRIWNQAGRNEPCPCGSGVKYKYCCKSG